MLSKCLKFFITQKWVGGKKYSPPLLQMMDSYQSQGLRFWQTRRAFYPAHVRSNTEKSVEYEKTSLQNLSGRKIDTDLVHNVLPFLWPSEFDQYMLNQGVTAWKESVESLPSNTAKALVLMLMSRKQLEPFFKSFLTLFNTDEKTLAIRMYEVGLGRHLKQFLLDHSEEVSYYKMMNPFACTRCLSLSPDLKHNHDYNDYSDTWFIADTGKIQPTKKFSLEQMTPAQIFIARMLCVASTARSNQWPECWAHCMSALDHVPPNRETRERYMSDLFCFIALSAGKSFLRLSIEIRALENAQQFCFNVEHLWKRIIVFHDLLVIRGFFNLEDRVFEKALCVVPFGTDYYYTLLKQHLSSLMHQTENILLYQHGRQMFHSKCDPKSCTKIFRVEFSLLKVESLIRSIDFWSRDVEDIGARDYYSAYVQVYTSMKTEKKNLDKINTHLTQGNLFLSGAIERMRNSVDHYKDAKIMKMFLSKTPFTIETVIEMYSQSTHLRYNNGGMETLFRLFLVAKYQNSFHQPNLPALQKALLEYHKKFTHDRGYRRDLIVKCCEVQEMCHSDGDVFTDFPQVDICLEKELLYDTAAVRYWNNEEKNIERLFDNDDEKPKSENCASASKKRKLSEPKPKADEKSIPDNDDLPIIPTSKSFIETGDMLNRHLYCFGYEISQHYLLK